MQNKLAYDRSSKVILNVLVYQNDRKKWSEEHFQYLKMVVPKIRNNIYLDHCCSRRDDENNKNIFISFVATLPTIVSK